MSGPAPGHKTVFPREPPLGHKTAPPETETPPESSSEAPPRETEAPPESSSEDTLPGNGIAARIVFRRHSPGTGIALSEDEIIVPGNVLPRNRKHLPNRHPKTLPRNRNRSFRGCDHRPRNCRLTETKSPLPDFRQGRFSKIRLPAPFPAPAESERVRLCPGLSKRSCPARSSREPACRETNGPNTPATWKPHRRSSGHWPGEAPASRRSRYPSWSSRRP